MQMEYHVEIGDPGVIPGFVKWAGNTPDDRGGGGGGGKGKGKDKGGAKQAAVQAPAKKKPAKKSK